MTHGTVEWSNSTGGYRLTGPGDGTAGVFTHVLPAAPTVVTWSLAVLAAFVSVSRFVVTMLPGRITVEWNRVPQPRLAPARTD